MAKPTCIACKGAGGGITPSDVEGLIDTALIPINEEISTKEDGWVEITEPTYNKLKEILKTNDIKFEYIASTTIATTGIFFKQANEFGDCLTTCVTKYDNYSGPVVAELNSSTLRLYGIPANRSGGSLQYHDFRVKDIDGITDIDSTNIDSYITVNGNSCNILKPFMIISPYGFTKIYYTTVAPFTIVVDDVNFTNTQYATINFKNLVTYLKTGTDEYLTNYIVTKRTSQSIQYNASSLKWYKRG